jgi:hypothetical protein
MFEQLFDFVTKRIVAGTALGEASSAVLRSRF